MGPKHKKMDCCSSLQGRLSIALLLWIAILRMAMEILGRVPVHVYSSTWRYRYTGRGGARLHGLHSSALVRTRVPRDNIEFQVHVYTSRCGGTQTYVKNVQ